MLKTASMVADMSEFLCLFLVSVMLHLMCNLGSSLAVDMDIFMPVSCHQNSDKLTKTVTNSIAYFRSNGGLQISPQIHDSCNEAVVLDKLVNLLKINNNQHIIIGPSNYGLCGPIARLAMYHNKPLISWKCSDSQFENTVLYKYFLRTLPSNTDTSNALGSILRHFLWKHISIVSSSQYPCWTFLKDVYVGLTNQGYIIDHMVELPDDEYFNTTTVLSRLKIITTETKAIIICIEESRLSALASTMEEAGLTSGDHALFIIDTHNSNHFDSEGTKSLNRNIPQSFLRSTILVHAHAHSIAVYENNRYTPTIGQNQWSDIDEYLFNAVSLAVSTLKKLNSISLPFYAENFFTTAQNITLRGLYTNLTNDGAKLPYYYSGWEYNLAKQTFIPALELSSDFSKVSTVSSFDWPNGKGPQANYCEFYYCEAEGFNPAYIVVIILVSVAVIGGSIVAAWFIRRRTILKEMEKGPNKIIILQDDLVFVSSKSLGKSAKSLHSTQHTNSQQLERPDLLKNSEPSLSQGSFPENLEYGDTARYNGDIVFVKQLEIRGMELKTKVRNYLKQLRDIRHENLNPFVGFYTDQMNPSVIFEHCTRRSLEDVIANEDMKLDWDFKLSLLTDLVRGMKYLHGSVLKIHGALKSGNCVIDSRWVLKITDYGVVPIYDKYAVRRNFQPKDLLWTAPEKLRDPELMYKGGTPKCDVYSFAIIMQEVVLRGHPFCMIELDAAEIIKKVRKPPPLCRPSVSQGAAPPQYIQIMKQCWSEMPDMRPEFEEINRQFKEINKGKKMNIVDTMFKMLEKYSSDLEETVQIRTLALEDEKKKTENLLSQMLPASVAISLMSGQRVEAESFDETTIYFSDIVGFTTISAMSTPLQVVDLLNDLYTAFDSTIDEYDVYKVETIGDAYMVCSGIPLKNGNRHAGEIGTLALALLCECGTFTIRHMPEVPLRLRIGIHSGPCVAGVVGLRMPRYCLFGDTINTASRMESTGLPFRVHVSPVTKVILDELGGYKLEYRGETELKGKGMVKSYWLVGKEGFTKKIPEPPTLSGDDNHGLASLVMNNKIKAIGNTEDKPPSNELSSENNKVHTSPSKVVSPAKKTSSSKSPRKISATSPRKASNTRKQSDSKVQTDSKKPADSFVRKFSAVQLSKTPPLKHSQKISPVPQRIEQNRKQSLESKKQVEQCHKNSNNTQDSNNKKLRSSRESVVSIDGKSETSSPHSKRDSIDSSRTNRSDYSQKSDVSTTTIQIHEKPDYQVSNV